jgi:uncharacterized NAD(P)/FAD-binding protein YdhS
MDTFTKKQLPIIIVGGGFSGTLTAIHLSRRLAHVPIFLFEEGREAGPGLAYQTAESVACLNIPAGKMSAFADLPDHFLDYARKVSGRNVRAGEFLPRSIYGSYLKDCLAKAIAENPLLKVDRRRVVDVTGIQENGAARVILRDLTGMDAAMVVLASGNQGSAFSSSIWAPQSISAHDSTALEKVGEGENVLIVGSGLTMMDTVLELDRAGRVGTIHAVSRHGLLPKPYAQADELKVPDLDHLPDSNLRRSLHLFRKAVREHEVKGGDWRDLFAALRSATPSLWQELSLRDRGRFLRFLSPFWEVHRHQCAPDAFDRVQKLIETGRLVLHQGTIVSVEKSTTGMRMGLGAKTREAATQWIEASHLFDATGPARDLNTVSHPLIKNLLRRGFLKPDEHLLGAETAADYRAVGRGGQPSNWLYIVGPMLRARYFEATAVHELRLHTSAVASRVEANYLSQHLEPVGVAV